MGKTDEMQLLEDTMKVLDILSLFLAPDSDDYIESTEVRNPLMAAFEQIRTVYESIQDEDSVEDIRDKWENDKALKSGWNTVNIDEVECDDDCDCDACHDDCDEEEDDEENSIN